MIKTNNTATFDVAKIYNANIIKCKLGLGLPWLRKAKPSIKWLRDVVLFKAIAMKPMIQETAAIRTQTTGVCDVSAVFLSSTLQEFSNSFPAVVCVGIQEIIDICHQKSVEAYIVE